MENTDYNIDLANLNKDKIKSKTYITNDIIYNIINNERDCTDDSLLLYRSIITDENNDILCFAPPSSIEYNNFITKYPLYDNYICEENDPTTVETHENDIFINELIEGTMINVFYDKRISSWEISTRSSIKANNWYYRTEYENQDKNQKTFREMFVNLLSFERYDKNYNEMETTAKLNEIFKHYPIDYCYSFVLQHPHNHIVLNILYPRAFLVAIYQKINTTNIRFISPLDYETWELFKKSNFYFPSHVTNEYFMDPNKKTYNEIVNIISKQTSMGLMITNIKTGERSIIINENYEKIKEIRGNHSNLEYHFYDLRSKEDTNALSEFLYHFPRYEAIFHYFENKYNHFILTVQQYYFIYYIKKNKSPIPKKYFIHVSRLHRNVFIPNKTVITVQVAKDYFDKMTAKEKYMYLNYEENHKPNIKKQKRMDDIEEEDDIVNNDIINDIINTGDIITNNIDADDIETGDKVTP